MEPDATIKYLEPGQFVDPNTFYLHLLVWAFLTFIMLQLSFAVWLKGRKKATRG